MDSEEREELHAPWNVFICYFGVLGGRVSFAGEGGGVGRGGREGYYRNADEMGTQDPGLNQTEEWLRIPSGCSQSLLLICLLGLVPVVLVKGWLCGDREAKKVFFLLFQPEIPGICPRGCSNLYSPRVQRGKEMDSTKYHSKEGPSVIVAVHSISQPFDWVTVNSALLLVTSHRHTQWNMNGYPAMALLALNCFVYV